MSRFLQSGQHLALQPIAYGTQDRMKFIVDQLLHHPS
jgi:hypothetical protein